MALLTPPRYAFYGTLRLGMENYSIRKNGLLFLASAQLQGFKMYSLVEYPYAVRTDNATDKITVELFEVLDASTEESIHELEREAGYIFDVVEIAKQKFGIFLFADHDEQDEWIAHGDWVQYRQETSF
jgi:gamma-glutamylcyclotransferase (GGCT)/AIG2-like uncharacterized protein YtfP